MSDRVERIRTALLRGLSPTRLEIVDDSAAHAGHAGAATGRGHFLVEIEAPAFAGLSPIACHRLVYAALGTLMETDIHAVSIRARAPQL
jgi:BolA protein